MYVYQFETNLEGNNISEIYETQFGHTIDILISLCVSIDMFVIYLFVMKIDRVAYYNL